MRQTIPDKGSKLVQWRCFFFSLTAIMFIQAIGFSYLFYNYRSDPSQFLSGIDTRMAISVKSQPSNETQSDTDKLSGALRKVMSTHSTTSTALSPNTAETLKLTRSRITTNTSMFSSFPSKTTNQENNSMDQLAPWVLSPEGREISTDGFTKETLTTSPPYRISYRPARDLRYQKHFQQIDDSEAWLYSAFYHKEEGMYEAQILIIGMARMYLNKDAFCHFEDRNGNFRSSTKAHVVWFPGAHKFNVTSCEFHCDVKQDFRPSYVKLSFQWLPETVTNHLYVHYVTELKWNFTVCLSPFHSNYSNTWQLVQTVEFNQLLGADHFFVYDFNMSQRVKEIVKGYEMDNVVTTLAWPVEGIEAFYHGQISAVADCIHRNRRASRFVVLTDIDEIIIPSLHDNWWDMLEAISLDDSLRDLDLYNEEKFLAIVRKRHGYEPGMTFNVTRVDNERMNDYLPITNDTLEEFVRVPQSLVSRHRRDLRQLLKDNQAVNWRDKQTSRHRDSQAIKHHDSHAIKHRDSQAIKHRDSQAINPNDEQKHEFGDERFLELRDKHVTKTEDPERMRHQNNLQMTANSEKLTESQSLATKSKSEIFINRNKERIDSFSFRCVFHTSKNIFSKKLQLENILANFTFSPEDLMILKRVPLAPLQDLARTSKPFIHGQRSKVIVRPELVNMAGIHHLKRHTVGYESAFVKTEVALLHHYRTRTPNACNVIDTSALRFKDTFIQRIKRIIRQFPFLLKS